jgi:hypothetical protein
LCLFSRLATAIANGAASKRINQNRFCFGMLVNNPYYSKPLPAELWDGVTVWELAQFVFGWSVFLRGLEGARGPAISGQWHGSFVALRPPQLSPKHFQVIWPARFKFRDHSNCLNYYLVNMSAQNQFYQVQKYLTRSFRLQLGFRWLSLLCRVLCVFLVFNWFAS